MTNLPDRLSIPGDVTLTDDERLTLVAALTELAHAAVVRARHEALLKSYGEDAGEIERLAMRGIALGSDRAPVRAAEQINAKDAVAAARAALAAEVRNASDLRGIVASAIRFAVTLVKPA